MHRHTFGVFLLCWPCGLVVSFDELFGSEGKLQVTYLNGITCNWGPYSCLFTHHEYIFLYFRFMQSGWNG